MRKTKRQKSSVGKLKHDEINEQIVMLHSVGVADPSDASEATGKEQ